MKNIAIPLGTLQVKFPILILLTSLCFTACNPLLRFGGTNFKSNKVKYLSTDRNKSIAFKHQNKNSDYLDKLKEKYPVEYLFEKSDTDMGKVLKVLNWTNGQWEHYGKSTPKKNDAISILEEAEQGGQFPCFAFAIVLRDQLNSLGFKARTVYLKTKDAKRSKRPPGHVATEVYLNDLKKWVFLDGQFNVMPELNGEPLNAVEFQKAITVQSDGLKLLSLNSVANEGGYYSFVYPYLYYIDTSLDNRYEPEVPYIINGKSSLMLVPVGANNLKRINFWDMDINNCIYTNSVLDFYAKPN